MAKMERGRAAVLAAIVMTVSAVLLTGCAKPEAPKDPSIPPPVGSPVPPMPSGAGGATPAPGGGPAPTGMPR